MRNTIPFVILIFVMWIFGGEILCAQQPFPFVAMAKDDSVNVRAGQNENFEIVVKLIKGEEVVVLDESYSWYKIKLPVNSESYISADFVQILKNGIGEVKGTRVNIRARAALGATVLAQLSKGALVRIIEKEDRWLKIEPLDNTYGWVKRDLLQFHSRDIPAARVVKIPSADQKKSLLAPVESSRKIDRSRILKRDVKSSPKISEVTSAVGVIQPLGDKALSQEIRHELIVDEQTVYFLRGYRSVIDGFLNHKVKIEGQAQGEHKSPHPVILVTKINLVL